MSSSDERGSATVADIASLIGGHVQGDPLQTVTGVSQNSELISEGDLFVALSGRNGHGAEFVSEALRAGAVAVLTDDRGEQLCADFCVASGVPLITAVDPRKRLGEICARIYGRPTMRLIGITGTNGKTTTAYMVMQGAKSLGLKVGMIGTLATYIGDTELSAVRTTPEAPEIYQLLKRMSLESIELVVMEVSSIAISEHRISGLNFDVVGFTNLSHDHLDYHETMENYFEAKAVLFTQDYAQRGVVCVNDSWGRKLLTLSEIPVQTVFIDVPSSEFEGQPDWRGVLDEHGDLVVRDPSGNIVQTPITSPGAVNAMNATMAIALLANVGLFASDTCHGVGSSVVPGRGQLVCVHNSVSIYVDYAHSPDAIESFLSGLHRLDHGSVITVMGAGGDRDTSKRPLMGAAAARHSHIVIVTDDNPRSEDPVAIRNSIVQGIPEYPNVRVENVEGRRNAFVRALELAQPGDRIAILGKGHESGIEIDGEVIPFNDSSVILELTHRV